MQHVLVCYRCVHTYVLKWLAVVNSVWQGVGLQLVLYRPMEINLCIGLMLCMCCSLVGCINLTAHATWRKDTSHAIWRGNGKACRDGTGVYVWTQRTVTWAWNVRYKTYPKTVWINIWGIVVYFISGFVFKIYIFLGIFSWIRTICVGFVYFSFS